MTEVHTWSDSKIQWAESPYIEAGLGWGGVTSAGTLASLRTGKEELEHEDSSPTPRSEKEKRQSRDPLPFPPAQAKEQTCSAILGVSWK